MVDVYEKLTLAEQLVFAKTGISLSDLQICVLRQSWQSQRKTYDQIAEELGYSSSYIKQGVAPKLWKLLSEVLEENVNKTNIHAVLERKLASQEQMGDPAPIERKQIAVIPTLKSIELEFPEGQVPLASPFYIERVPYEQRCYEKIVKPGAFLHIKAPKQMGKTSLSIRILAFAAQLGYRTASLNLLQADKATIADLDKFLRWFAFNISRKLKLEAKLENYWHEDLGSKASCTSYFQDYLLAQIKSPVVLALDELNEIFAHPQIAQDFFSLLRSWYEEAKNSEIWQKLRLVALNSTEVYIPLNINCSPFQVGLSIQLRPFSWEQVQELAGRHGIDLAKDELAELMFLTGGHPYLLRLALYYLTRRDLTLEELIQTADSDTGIYSDHLHRILWYLQQHPDVLTALQQVVKAKAPIKLEQVQAFKLHGMGLVNLRGSRAMTSCNLYERYFRAVLS